MHIRNITLLLAPLVLGAVVLQGCSKSIEKAGPEAIQDLDQRDYDAVEKLAKSVKGLGDFRPSPSESSILERVAASGPSHLVQVLVEGGANVKNKAADGHNAITMVVDFDADPASIKILADAGADPNATRSDGTTPLMSAAQKGRPAMVEALLAAGADTELKSHFLGENATALQMAKATRALLAGPRVTTAQAATNMSALAGAAVTAGAGKTKIEDLDKVIQLLESAKPGK